MGRHCHEIEFRWSIVKSFNQFTYKQQQQKNGVFDGIPNQINGGVYQIF